MPLERGEMSPPSRPHHPHIAMSDCIVNVTGGELPAKEIEALVEQQARQTVCR